ncbi:MAG TPA: hypothetical protein VGR05_08815, partial [Sphingomicrobium sp.]|nr:hypothetical protein [Sphingomicrobium sp.]
MPTIIPSLPTTPTVTPLTASVTVPSNDWVPYTIGAGDTLYATTLHTLLQTSTNTYGFIGPLTNNGTMWLDVNSTMWNLLANDVAGVDNNGLMVLRVAPGVTTDAIGFQETSFGNDGQLFVINEGFGDAIAVDSYIGGSPINTGLIAVQALNGTAYGFLFNNPSWLDNRAGGQILIEGMGAIAYYQASGDHPLYPSMINNAGTIRAVSLDPEQLSFGLYLGGYGAGNRYIITNSGQISADVAIYGADDYATVVGEVMHEVRNVAGGQIDGLIYLQRGADIVVNAGVIIGDVLMGEGADRVDNRTGTINGIIDLGWNDDIYQGGGGVDLAAGGSGNDNMEGGGGNDQLMGGGGNDVLVGGSGNDGLFGEWGNDRIVTAGGDYVDGGEGNDRIELGDYTFESVSGGDGFDTLVLPGPAGVRTINLSAALAEGAFSDFEQVELTGGKTLVIQTSDVTALTGGETTLRVVTTGSDRVNLVGTWTAGANQLIDGVSWRSFSSAGVTILVQGNGLVAPNGANSPGALDPFAGGDLAPVPGTTWLDFTSAVEVLDYYELNVPLTIEAHETYRSADGGVIFTCWDSSASLTNYGLIESIGPYASALSTNNISSVVNHGTIRVEATAVGFGAGAIYSDHFTDVDNYGLISAVALGGDAYGVWTASGTNSGTIEARTTTGSAYAVLVFNGVFVPFENSGLIAAISGGLAPGSTGAAAIGVQFAIVKDAVNSGTIIATAEEGLAMAVTFSTGIYQSTFINTGTIIATSVVPHPAYPTQIAIKAYTDYGSSTFELINGSQGEIYGDVYLDGAGSMTVQNSGLIDGSIWLGAFGVYPAGAVSINNLGQITGDVRLGSENAVSATNNGRIDGAITLGLANDWFDGRLGIQGGLISGNDGSDTIFGGVGAETINGGGGGDTLIGGLGADLLTGGSGNDIFRDTKVGLSGDTITDLGLGDTIILTDATLTGFTFNLTGNTLTFTGGSLTLQGSFAGYQFVAGAASGGGVQLTIQASAIPDVRNDFNGDGRSDILWRNVDGQLSNWLGQANGGFTPNNTNAAAVVPTDWQVVGTGD